MLVLFFGLWVSLLQVDGRFGMEEVVVSRLRRRVVCEVCGLLVARGMHCWLVEAWPS